MLCQKFNFVLSQFWYFRHGRRLLCSGLWGWIHSGWFFISQIPSAPGISRTFAQWAWRVQQRRSEMLGVSLILCSKVSVNLTEDVSANPASIFRYSRMWRPSHHTCAKNKIYTYIIMPDNEQDAWISLGVSGNAWRPSCQMLLQGLRASNSSKLREQGGPQASGEWWWLLGFVFKGNVRTRKVCSMYIVWIKHISIMSSNSFGT